MLAGVNGAGRSSVAGAAIRAAGGEYFNPDEAAQAVLAASPGVSRHAANAAAWEQGRRLLERAISTGSDFALETTLGGTTIPRLLHAATDAGHAVLVRYVGLDSADRHIARVRARVAAGGHDIPEAMIRTRFETSRLNLIGLLPRLTALDVFDNSTEASMTETGRPAPVLLLRWDRGRVAAVAPLAAIPSWAKPIVMTALRAQRGR